MKGKIWPPRVNWPCSCCSSFLHFSLEAGWFPQLGWVGSSVPSSCPFFLFVSVLSFSVRGKNKLPLPLRYTANPLVRQKENLLTAEKQKKAMSQLSNGSFCLKDKFYFLTKWQSGVENFQTLVQRFWAGLLPEQSGESQWGQLPLAAARGCFLSSWGIVGRIWSSAYPEALVTLRGYVSFVLLEWMKCVEDKSAHACRNTHICLLTDSIM